MKTAEAYAQAIAICGEPPPAPTFRDLVNADEDDQLIDGKIVPGKQHNPGETDPSNILLLSVWQSQMSAYQGRFDSVFRALLMEG